MVDATLQNLVMVDSVEVLLLESFPVQVSITVAGNKSVPCVELQPVAVSREGDLFTVVIAETSLGPAETCIAVLDPFELSVALVCSACLQAPTVLMSMARKPSFRWMSTTSDPGSAAAVARTLGSEGR